MDIAEPEGPADREFDSVPVPPDVPVGWRTTDATPAQALEAERLEYEVFLAAGFCDPSPQHRAHEFDPWRGTSRFQVVVSPDGTVQGAVRLMVGAYAQLPVGAFERTVPVPADPVLEYASLAVSADQRRTGVAEALYRAVWQQALREGVEGIVAIGEGWLVEILNGVYNFGFRQLGPSRWYMGGDCFPMGTEISALLERLKRQPSFFRWVSSEIDLRDLPEPAVREAVRTVRSTT